MRFPPRARTGRLWVTRCHGRMDAASREETAPKRRNCTASPDRSFQVHQSQPGGAAEALDPGGGCRALVAGANTHSPRTGTSPRVTEGLLHQSALPTCSIRVSMYDHVWFPPGDVSWHRQQEPRGSDEDPQLVSTAQTPLLQ